MTWFWSTPQWAEYCEAYGLSAPIDNYHPLNIVVPLGPPDRMLENMRQTTRQCVRQADQTNQANGITAAWRRDRAAFDAYQRLHEEASGRKTRPQQTFDLMYEFIDQGYGQLLVVWDTNFVEERDGSFVLLGASYFYTHQDGVYYGSSARDPAAAGMLVGHLMIWSALQHFSALGYKWLDLGYGHIVEDATEEDRKKQAAIIMFKRGFVRNRVLTPA